VGGEALWLDALVYIWLGVFVESNGGGSLRCLKYTTRVAYCADRIPFPVKEISSPISYNLYLHGTNYNPTKNQQFVHTNKIVYINYSMPLQ